MNNKSSIVALVVVAIIAAGAYIPKAPVVNVSPTPVNVNVPEQKTPIVNVSAPEVRPTINVPEPRVLGSQPGPDFIFPVSFQAGVVYKNRLSTTTPASMTLKLSDVRDYDTVIVKPTGAAASKTLTFFASSTAASWLPKAGDTQVTCFLNATSTAATTLVFAAGTGIDLKMASSTNTTLAKDVTLAADGTACFRFIRKAQDSTIANSFDIQANFVEYEDAD